MSRPGPEGLLVPLMDLWLLGRRAVTLRLALVKADLSSRTSSVLTALILGLAAVILLVMVMILLLQAGLVGLALLGLTPLEALLISAIVCTLLAVILLVIARSCLRKATLPLTSLAGSGETLPTTRL